MDEDDDEDDSCPDAAPTDGPEHCGGSGASTSGHGPPTDPPAAVDCGKRELQEEGGPGPVHADALDRARGVNLNAHSDPPGALRYLNSDSDVPAPAAPTVNVARFSGAAKPLWMQPDPTMTPGTLLGPPGQGPELGLRGSLSRESAFSALGSRSEVVVDGGGGACGRNSCCSLDAGCRGVKRGRDEAAEAGALGQPGRQAALPPRSSPFAEVAAAAAAAAGLPAVRAVPAARDAAALLRSAAAASTVSAPWGRFFQRHDAPWVEPAWLRRVGLELEALMREMGLPVVDADRNAAALPGVLGRPRVLCSAEPLILPDPGPRRDLDALLRRRLLADGSGALGQPLAPADGRETLAVRGMGRLGGGVECGVHGGFGVHGGGGNGVPPRYMAIEGLSLDALL